MRSTPVSFGPFELVARLGVGGMGEVFLARRDGHEVALKLIRPELASHESFRRMFANEARIGRRLQHAHLVRVLDDGVLDGVAYLVLEYVDGASLDKLLEDGPLSAVATVALGRQLSDGLRFAHEACDEAGAPLQLLHRDVSCSNVLVGRGGVVKLADFGVGRAGSQTTSTHALKGKRSYFAPELLRDGPDAFAPVTDLFACGVVLHHALTGAPPFDDALEWARLGGPLSLDGALGAVLRRALAPAPADRFGSARELGDALSALPEAACTREGVAELKERVARLPRGRPALADVDRLILDELRGVAFERTVPHARHKRRARSRRAALSIGVGLALLSTAAGYRLVSRRPAAPASATAPPAQPPPPPAPALDAPAPPPPPESAHAATTSPTLSRAHPSERPRARTGLLTLETDPWGTAWLGERRLGVTPFARVRVPAGRHQLALDVQNSGRRRFIDVVVPAGEEARVSIHLPAGAPARGR